MFKAGLAVLYPELKWGKLAFFLVIFLTLFGKLLCLKDPHVAVIVREFLSCFYGKCFHINVHLPLG